MSDDILMPKSQIVEAACRVDFLSFFQWSFQFLEPATPLHLNWHHFALAHYLELVLSGAITRLIIAGAPRTLKSLMASVVFPCYILGRNPSARIIGISHSSDLQINFSNQCRALIEAPRYGELFARTRLAKSTETEFHTTLGGNRYARSAEGSLTGLGGNILILDDFQKPLDMHSAARRNSTTNIYYETVASRINNQHSGAIVVVGQRLHPDDLIGTLLRSEENWTVLSLPAIAEKEESIPIGYGRHHLRHPGDLLDPQQQSLALLKAIRSQDPETYWAQYQQSPIPSGGFLIKQDQIQYCDQLPRRTSSSTYIQSWDPGQKSGEANSRSACLDIIVQDDKYFIAQASADQWDYHELEQRVLSRAHEQKPDVILIEDTGLGTALISVLKCKNLPVVAVKPEGDKKARLLKHISKFANGHVFLLKTATGHSILEDELFAFPSGRRNDLVDALTQALGHERVRHLWTPEALDNYSSLVFSLATNPW